MRIAEQEEDTPYEVGAGHDRNETGTVVRREVDGREQGGGQHHQAVLDVVGEDIPGEVHLYLIVSTRRLQNLSIGALCLS